MRKIVVGFFSATLFLTCSSKRIFDHDYFQIGISQGIIDNSEINEASGLASSKNYPSMFWTHNDSGDKPRIFLITDKAKYRATFYLQGIKNRDWEEIAQGPGPVESKSYLYIGEIGDNLGLHNYKYIYRIEEPDFSPEESTALIDTVDHGIDSIKFSLSDGARDTEAFLVDPTTKNIYIFSKREKKEVNLYVLPYPQSTEKPIIAKFLMHIPFTQITAADISVDGKEVLIKNYQHIYYWKKNGNESLEDLLKKEPAHLPYAEEPQGEAIAFDRNGKGYYTLSEESKAKKPHLMFYKRISPN
jgi:hypothetical protein